MTMEIQGNKEWPGTNCWRCLVCSTPQHDLLVLPCAHRFCEDCLHTWLGIYIMKYNDQEHRGRFPCQICWSLYTIPPEGTGVYKQNYQVLLLESDLDKLTMSVKESTSGKDMEVANEMAINTNIVSSHQLHQADYMYDSYRCYCRRGHLF